jgi:Fur family transcriptional regulator, ferric uptake regulator
MLSKNLLIQLKDTGYKLTTPRVEILKVLSLKNPLSAQEVFEILKGRRLDVDLVTAYRTLELFKDLGFVQKVQFEDNVARYELVDGDLHHHHLVCIRCGNIEEISLDETNFVARVEGKTGFKVERHSLEFFGFCRNCQEK